MKVFISSIMTIAASFALAMTETASCGKAKVYHAREWYSTSGKHELPIFIPNTQESRTAKYRMTLKMKASHPTSSLPQPHCRSDFVVTNESKQIRDHGFIGFDEFKIKNGECVFEADLPQPYDTYYGTESVRQWAVQYAWEAYEPVTEFKIEMTPTCR